MARTNEDLPLGADTPLDTTPTAPTNPADFDVDSWLAGVRPTRRSVLLYDRADLLARLDTLATHIESLPDGDEADELIDEFDRVKAEFTDGRWFTVEGRSKEWEAEFRREELTRLGVKRGSEGSARQRTKVLLAQLAEQIVDPPVTAEQLEQLNEANAGELNKLVVAMTFANNQVAEASSVLKLDFSSRRSVTTRR